MKWDSCWGVGCVCAVSVLVLACGGSSAMKVEESAGKSGAGAGSSGDDSRLSEGGSGGTEGGPESPETPVATCTFERWATIFGFAPIHIDVGHLNSDASVDLLGTPSGCCATLPQDIHDVLFFVAGDAEFEQLPGVTVPEGSLDTGSLDLDGDGLSDLAVLGEGVLRLFLNQEDGFEPAGEHSVEASRVEVYDATGDGVPDLVLSSSEAFVIPGGTEPGSVSAPLTMPLSELPLNGPDLDEDGEADSVSFANGTLAIALSDPDGTQRAEYPTSLAGSSGYGEPLATTGDFDGDGHRDVLYGYSQRGRTQGGEAAVRLGRGDGSFGPESLVSLPSNKVFDLIGADVTGDGGDDLVAIGRGPTDHPFVEVFRSACTAAGE